MAKLKFTKEKKDKCCEIVSAGHTHKAAYGFVKIHCDTFYRHLNDDPEFSESLKKAEAQAQMGLLEAIKSAIPKSWQAAAWILERRWKDEFALRTYTEHSGEIKHKHEDEDKQPDEIEQEIELLYAEVEAIANQNGDKKKKEDTG